jgi:hypothetical protein
MGPMPSFPSSFLLEDGDYYGHEVPMFIHKYATIHFCELKWGLQKF